METFHSNGLPNESDDCLGRYVDFGFGLADRPLGIRLTESMESTKPLVLGCMDFCNGFAGWKISG